MEERLNKVIARAGFASRRGADELIQAGRITVNGKVVTQMGMKVDPFGDEIFFDGERIRLEHLQNRYIAFYKPRNVITTSSDPFQRSTVMDFIDSNERLFPVGRLDSNSEGLLILTNDGDLANQLTHPRYEHEKEYRIKISGTPLQSTLKKWRQGMWLEEGRTLPAKVRVESSTGAGTWLRFVIREGKNRQIRRMVEAFNHRIHKLVRLRVGPILLGKLKAGEWRELKPQELEALRQGSNKPVYHADAPQSAEQKEKPKYKTGWARPKDKPNRRFDKSPRSKTERRGQKSKTSPSQKLKGKKAKVKRKPPFGTQA
ncbi:MAG: pseudouridine synthase [Ardenticatenaceae bacterium]